MYDRNHRICPSCGEKLILSEPCLEITEDVGFSNGMAVYSCVGLKAYRGNSFGHRMFSYTSRREKSYPIMLDGAFGGKGVTCPVAGVRKRLSKDRLFHPLNVMYCKSCKARIALNRNPLRIFDDVTSFLLLAISITLLVCGAFLQSFTALMWISGVIGALYMVYILWAIVYWVFIKKCCSNFVALDFTLRPVKMTADIRAEVEKNSVYFSESNIFEAIIGDIKYSLYVLSCKGRIVEFHILGKEIPSNIPSEITLIFENKCSFGAKIKEYKEK